MDLYGIKWRNDCKYKIIVGGPLEMSPRVDSTCISIFFKFQIAYLTSYFSYFNGCSCLTVLFVIKCFRASFAFKFS